LAVVLLLNDKNMNLSNTIETLAAFEPSGAKFISIYLDAKAKENGREDYGAWLKTQFYEYGVQFENSEEIERDYKEIQERIYDFLETQAEDAANGIAVFAEVGGEFFETVQLDEAFPNNRFFVFDRPHLFPLVRIVEQNPKYAVLWADTNKADIYIFGGENDLNVETETRAKVEEIQNTTTQRTKVGGWSQARYQRHIENFHLQHAKETVEELEKLMRKAKIEHLVLCGDETTIMPILRPQLSKETDEKVIAVLNMSQYASEEEIREKTRESLSIENATKDKERVERLFNAAKSSAGLGTLGVEETLAALSNGQVEELVLSANFEAIKYNPREVEKVLKDYAPGDDNSASEELPEASEKRQIGDELIIRALNSAAKIVFIEDESLLESEGGVGAVLRYNMNATAS
jgi:peptide chain release factor subunit 1